MNYQNSKNSQNNPSNNKEVLVRLDDVLAELERIKDAQVSPIRFVKNREESLMEEVIRAVKSLQPVETLEDVLLRFTKMKGETILRFYPNDSEWSARYYPFGNEIKTIMSPTNGF